MDKKVYNKPSLKLEIFTPNEYIATCWYIAEGDCYSGPIYQDTNDTFKNNDNYTILNLSNHGTHNVPANGFFRTVGENPIPEPIPITPSGTNSHWYYGGQNPSLPPNNTSWSSYGFSRISSYYLFEESNGTKHYFTKISYASNKNATS